VTFVMSIREAEEVKDRADIIAFTGAPEDRTGVTSPTRSSGVDATTGTWT